MKQWRFVGLIYCLTGFGYWLDTDLFLFLSTEMISPLSGLLQLICVLFYQIIRTWPAMSNRGEEFRQHLLVFWHNPEVFWDIFTSLRSKWLISLFFFYFFSPRPLFTSTTLSPSVSLSSSATLHPCMEATPPWPSARWSSPWSSSASSWWRWTSRSKWSTGSGAWVLYVSYHTFLSIVAQCFIFCFPLLCRIFSALVLAPSFTSSLLWSVWLAELGTALESQAGSVKPPWTECSNCSYASFCVFVLLFWRPLPVVYESVALQVWKLKPGGGVCNHLMCLTNTQTLRKTHSDHISCFLPVWV